MRTINTSGYKGVSFNKKIKRWIARTTIGNKTVHLGCFHSIKEASDCYDKSLVESFGNYAFTNKERLCVHA